MTAVKPSIVIKRYANRKLYDTRASRYITLSQISKLLEAGEVVQILDRESVDNKVVPIGHDWGSATCQRLYLYHKSRCIGLVLLSLCYQIPTTTPFDLDKANQETARRFGYPQWEYWNFFTVPDAPDLLKKHADRFYKIM